MLKEFWGKVSYYTFLGLLIIFGLFFGELNVRAADDLGIYAAYNGYNEVSGCTSNGKFNYDTIGPNLQGQIAFNQGNVNTAISGKAKNIYIAFKHDLEAQKTYDLTINFYGSDLTNKLKSNNVYIYDGSTCGDMTSEHISLVSFKNNATSSSNTNKLVLRIYAPSLIPNWGVLFRGGNSYITSVSNFGIKSATLQVVDTTGTSDLINNQNNNTNTMIDNNNENTQNIINNNNQNTQDIINNQNQQSNNEISSQNVCRALKYGTNCGYLGQQGQLQTQDCNTSNNRTTDYIEVNSQSTITLYKQANNGSWRLCFYDNSKTNISCIFNGNYNEGDNIPIPTNTKYIRYTTNITSGQRYHLCSNGNQALNDSVNDLNDSINNDDVDNPTSFIEDMEDLLPHNGVITNLITLPIQLFTKVLNSINGTCQSFNLGNLYGTNLIMPCIEVSNYLGSTLWNTIDLIISGVFVLTIAKKMIKAFESFTGMKEGDVIND